MTVRKKGMPIGVFAVIFVAMMIAYPISIGPALWLSDRFGVSHDWMNVAYGPILHIANAIGATGVLRRYLIWFDWS